MQADEGSEQPTGGAVLTEHLSDGIRVLWLNRARRLNALNHDLIDSLIDALEVKVGLCGCDLISSTWMSYR